MTRSLKNSTFIEEWLNKVNTISLSGCIKSWIVDNVVVSHFSWPLLIYDFPQSVVQNWSNRCRLKMSRCAETSILFRNRQENFGLGFKNLEIENKCFQIVKMAHYEVFYGWPNASTLYTQIESRESRKTWKR